MARSALVLFLAVLAAAGCARGDAKPPAAAVAPAPWVSRAVPEARGDVRTSDGKRVAVRYAGWTTEDFAAFRTYAYGDVRSEPPVAHAMMPNVTPDPKRGRSLFLSRSVGPCTGCHLVQGADVWPAGNVGPDLSTYGDRKLPLVHTFGIIYDPRHLYPLSIMPAWGGAGVLSLEDIVHVAAFLDTQRSPVPAEKDRERDPKTRALPVGFGENLDPTNNPAVLRAEGADDFWSEPGPRAKACADCHAGGPLASMKGVAARYPRHVAAYGRVMAVEDFLEVHAPETTGHALAAESPLNLDVTMRIKMASNGLPVRLDLGAPETAAALARGKASFFKRVGQRNHSCADCHTRENGRGADKFLGGRLLADVEAGLTRHFPTWRTSQADVWDLRKRMQWCMTPLGMNMLPADSVEYAELELYLASFDHGRPLSVPGIRH